MVWLKNSNMIANCVAVAGLLLLTCGGAQDTGSGQSETVASRLNESARHQEWITIDTPHGTQLKAFIVYPQVETPATSVIVIHENRGLNDWVRSVADRLAEEGFVAIAPDLLSGKGPEGGGADSFASGDDLRRALGELTPEEMAGNLKATADYLRGLSATTDKVAVSGFCWGGRNTFRYATNDPGIAGAFVFYGSPPDEEALERINCPVYGFYGGSDNRVTSTVEATVESMNRLNKTYDPVIYPGAGHGFMRSGEAEDATPENKDAREKGWERFLALLRQL